jgi:carboxymethylenebutenolidase
MSSRITIKADDGASFNAYVSTTGAARRPALIICPEVFGVNPHMRSVADKFAAAGYLAVVPDMFWRIEPDLEIPYDDAGLKRGSEILKQFDCSLGAKDLGLVVGEVLARPDCSGKVGVVGFCVGGTLAYLAATRLGVDAAVGYYAKGVEDYLNEVASAECGLLLHYGEADRFIPPPIVHKVEAALAGKPNAQVFTYAGVDHGFNSNDRRAYNAEAAGIAMARTMRLLDRALKPV